MAVGSRQLAAKAFDVGTGVDMEELFVFVGKKLNHIREGREKSQRK
ncbi:MAG: hypothetical protein RQ936_07265 [Gammaproteobacteria bacterium]|nr:hypothetical protein [Gammaproteobacteria bacterium]